MFNWSFLCFRVFGTITVIKLYLFIFYFWNRIIFAISYLVHLGKLLAVKSFSDHVLRYLVSMNAFSSLAMETMRLYGGNISITDTNIIINISITDSSITDGNHNYKWLTMPFFMLCVKNKQGLSNFCQ